MKIDEVLSKLLGKIEPAGSHGFDMERLDNIENYNDALFYIIKELLEASKNKDDYRASVSLIGERAYEVLLDLKETLKDIEE